MIGIIDLGLGNIKSVNNALNYIGAKARVVQLSEDIDLCDKLILPGVGAFGKGCEALFSTSLGNKIRIAVLEQEKPILGICLGMQLLACTSEETPGITGLNLIEGNSHIICADNKELKVPHIGWNDVSLKASCELFSDIVEPVFYFLHSYHVKVGDYKLVTAVANYGSEITVAFSSNNIHGVQFHPEKSQEAGLQVLRNFCKITQ